MISVKIKLTAFFVAKDGETVYSQQKQDLELTMAQIDHQLLIAKFRLKLNKTGGNTRLARYDLNEIPYEFTIYLWIDLKD